MNQQSNDQQSNDQQSKKAALKPVYLLPLILFFAMVVLLYTGLGKDPTKLDSQLIGKNIPVFQKGLLLDPDKTISNTDIQGPALLNVFGSWCPSCYQEHKYLMDFKANNTIKIIGLNYKDTRRDGLKFISDLGNPYEFIIFDNNGRLGIELGVYGAPETFVIDANNLIIYRHVGVVTDKVWLKKIKPMLMAEAGGTR